MKRHQSEEDTCTTVVNWAVSDYWSFSVQCRYWRQASSITCNEFISDTRTTLPPPPPPLIHTHRQRQWQRQRHKDQPVMPTVTPPPPPFQQVIRRETSATSDFWACALGDHNSTRAEAERQEEQPTGAPLGGADRLYLHVQPRASCFTRRCLSLPMQLHAYKWVPDTSRRRKMVLTTQRWGSASLSPGGMLWYQGRSYRGFGGFGRTPHGPEKVRKFGFFFFFFFFWARSHRKASSLKRTKGRRQQKTSHARRGMARLTFKWHFHQTPSPPKKTSRS